VSSNWNSLVGVDRSLTSRLRTAFGLEPGVAQVMGMLLKRDFVTHDALYVVLYAARPECDWPDARIVDVQISRLRRALRRHGITIKTQWGEGWLMSAADKASGPRRYGFRRRLRGGRRHRYDSEYEILGSLSDLLAGSCEQVPAAERNSPAAWRDRAHWQRAGHRADHLHAFAFETGADDRQCRGDQSDPLFECTSRTDTGKSSYLIG